MKKSSRKNSAPKKNSSKKAEKKLLGSQELINKSQEIAHLGSWELDLVNNKLSWSNETYRIFGLKPKEFDATYEAFLEAVYPDDRKAVDDAYSSSLREGRDSYDIEHRIVRKSNGEVRIVHEKCEHIRDNSGRVICSIGMVHDITERRRAEEEVENIAKFPSQNPFPILRIGRKGAVLYCNDAGLPRLEEWKSGVGQLAPDRWRRLIAEVFRFGKKREIEETQGNKTFSYIFVPIGNLEYVNVYGHDITERKKLEQQKDEFLSIVSHEIKNPLTVIKLCTESTMQYFSKNNDTDNFNDVYQASLAVDKINSLIDDLLDVARIEAGKFSFNISTFNFGDFVRQTIRSLEYVSRGHKIILRGKASVKVKGDKERIAQVLTNFMTNAVKYSPYSSKIIVEVRRDKKKVTLSVQDFGTGIAKCQQPHVFEKYYRDKRVEKRTQGTGLGLYISKEIINLHKGKIWVKSKKNKGSTFYFSLPVT